MQIEVDEVTEYPDYTDTDRYKKMKNKVYSMAKNKKLFDLTDLPAAEYKYYSTMYNIFLRLIAKEITPDEATAQNTKAYDAFKAEQAMHNQRIFDIIQWQDNIRRSELARSRARKAENRKEAITALIDCIEAMTNDATLRDLIPRWGNDDGK